MSFWALGLISCCSRKTGLAGFAFRLYISLIYLKGAQKWTNDFLTIRSLQLSRKFPFFLRSFASRVKRVKQIIYGKDWKHNLLISSKWQSATRRWVSGLLRREGSNSISSCRLKEFQFHATIVKLRSCFSTFALPETSNNENINNSQHTSSQHTQESW